MTVTRTSSGGSINMNGRADARPTEDAEAKARAAMQERTRNAHKQPSADGARVDDVGAFSQTEAKLAGGAFDDPSAVWRTLESAARAIAGLTHKPEEREAEVRRLLDDSKRRINAIRAQAGRSLLP